MRVLLVSNATCIYTHELSIASTMLGAVAVRMNGIILYSADYVRTSCDHPCHMSSKEWLRSVNVSSRLW